MINRLLNYMNESTCNFMAVETLERELKKNGYCELKPEEKWNLKRGSKYYMKKNGSAIFAVTIGQRPLVESGFKIISAHSDSPCFKIKPNAEIYGDGGVVSLNVEKYGGGILYTWFDRPLSISGRVALRGENSLMPVIRTFDLKRPVATIPHLAIHFNRAVNDGNPLSVQKDMKPVVGIFSSEEIEKYKKNGGVIKTIVAQELAIKPEDILDYELCLYPIQEATLTGVNSEYIQSGRLDDLSMAFAGLEAILSSADEQTTHVLAIFDNEETGSGTKQGAASPVLKNMLARIVETIEVGEEQAFYRALAHSFLISADDAHAWHPNYNEKYDPTNHPVLGGGPAIKINANCKYMTDADGAAVFKNICDKAGVNCQYFVNHSDVLGGSTLGNILTSQMDVRGVDMGNPIWAMHSATETASVEDHKSVVKAFTTFYDIL